MARPSGAPTRECCLSEASTATIQYVCNDQHGNDESDGSDAPSSAHSPIQAAAAAEEQQQENQNQYHIHGMILIL
jgi:hypothetical protein